MLDMDGSLTDARAVLVIADETDDGPGETAALAGIDAHVVTASWGGAPTTIAQHPRITAIYADARAVPADGLSDVLRAIAGGTDARLVIEMLPAQIDVVAAAMPPTDAILLCEPTMAERTAALTLAALDDGLSARDTSRDARRYEQLNQEVARIAETLARLAGAEARGADEPVRADPFVADRMLGFDAQPAVALDPGDIRRAIRARRLRDDAFDLPGLFEDPAWDMLLDLFAAELERRRVSVSSLCIAAAVAPTTALRWIGKLIDAGLLDRRPDDFDRRRAFISLTARASTAMRNYVAALRRAGLAIA